MIKAKLPWRQEINEIKTKKSNFKVIGLSLCKFDLFFFFLGNCQKCNSKLQVWIQYYGINNYYWFEFESQK